MLTTLRKRNQKRTIVLGSWLVLVYQGCTSNGKQSMKQQLYAPTEAISAIPSAPSRSLSEDLPELKSLTKKEAKQKAKNKLTETEKAINQCFNYARHIQQKNYQEQLGEIMLHKTCITWIGHRLLQSSIQTKTGQIGLLEATFTDAMQYFHEATPYILQAKQLKSNKAYKKMHQTHEKLRKQLDFIRDEIVQINAFMKQQHVFRK
ncbi:hypothetical protein [Candidatus Cardinium hertigii]|uniref:Uncharacterized protein n=1 Tax=Candidatus Cardinium hertigii TaxID=247481 RepID=A0A2Z3LGV9_9BACT|nr:hypothetical protein [Candidatus Cardinium hertigii]AWN81644.1 hypothetical protein DK880_00315 [Candidatus Cardinium hertigii]